MSKRVKLRNFFLACTILVMLLVAIYSGLQFLELTMFPSNEITATGNKTIVRDGVEYFPRQDITVIMVVGVDQYGPAEDSGFYKNSAAADMVILLIFDETTKEYTILQLNRDTMVNMPILGLQGKEAGTYYGQLALSHTYGSGLDDSSINVKNTLMNFLHGLTIDHYITIRMDAIAILNDAAGGVTVNVTEDFSDVNPDIPLGKFTLQGTQALDYIRTRKNLGDQMNLSRMERQQEYIKSFLETLSQKAEGDVGFAVKSFNSIAPYLVTDYSVEKFSSMADRYKNYTLRDIVSPKGDNYVVDGYYQFHVDPESLDALIVRLFYGPKNH